MDERFDRLEQKLDQKFAEGCTHRLMASKRSSANGSTASKRSSEGCRAVEQTLRGHIEDVDAHLGGKLDTLNLKVDVLHEDVKSDFKFSLEARQGLKELVAAGAGGWM